MVAHFFELHVNNSQLIHKFDFWEMVEQHSSYYTKQPKLTQKTKICPKIEL
jgi:hypothetical protein